MPSNGPASISASRSSATTAGRRGWCAAIISAATRARCSGEL
jgi:hypothetical protein